MAPTDRRTNKTRFLAYGVALTVAVGTSAWLLWKSSREEDDIKATEPTHKYKSKCIIMTKTISELQDIKWASILKDPSVVVIVVPQADFPQLAYPNQIIDSEDLFKIIHCDTDGGVWACVKSLKKDELVLVSRDLEHEIPEDIIRYVKHIKDIKDTSEIVSYLNNYIS
ncbi:similar to Saccharomyces cerevisiae YAL055W PEX22 Putative peroxisomal membrane protein required for import of peroxisomal proteins [Maudiozyma barnettii]|uniref:Peroxisome assembly protein 22 n=1 Tax=Maudiozyma barnettii TaxID=61262 RepID=A0A8H2ZGP9_9SACH|nr:ubiquitin-protein transferase activating protein PEX22 [Kazachstania barnettii]CAB4254829.1 similar to Saccharomyces cerevisiae YAL055W PEX22 Putative peroxisomal membrane protein required for import of peroxisomal proteins [Kazachstania barnettii]CAD1783019.1 similar to Saccharomyces cerevisiae YAL055W PEX22 Putative peroxisomal membrane protein required for import of peroxisomal proteins [Kazachstania barnettii]